jgi:glutamate-1-semialdehyde 2,1-aminomutase
MATAGRSDARRHASYFRAMLERGIYLAPSPFEALFVSRAHTEEDLDKTIDSTRESLKTAFRSLPS